MRANILSANGIQNPRDIIRIRASEAQADLPEGRIGGLIAQLRDRASSAENRSSIVLIALVLVILAGLAFYLLLPFWEQYADSRKQTLQTTVNAIDAEENALNLQRATLVKKLGEELAIVTELHPSGLQANFEGHEVLENGDLLLYGGLESYSFYGSGTVSMSKLDGEEEPTYGNLAVGNFSDNEFGFVMTLSSPRRGFFNHLTLADRTIVLYGLGEDVFRSTRGGGNFVSISLPPDIDISPTSHIIIDDITFLLLGAGSNLVRSSDGGTSF